MVSLGILMNKSDKIAIKEVKQVKEIPQTHYLIIQPQQNIFEEDVQSNRPVIFFTLLLFAFTRCFF